MSLPDPEKTDVSRVLRHIALAGLIGSLALVSACTVRPLYSNAPLSAGSNASANAELASIGIKPVKTRYAQQVRNNLIFGFGRGAGEPASPAYSLDLSVTEAVESSALVQVGTDQDEPTAGSVTLTASSTLNWYLPPLLRITTISREKAPAGPAARSREQASSKPVRRRARDWVMAKMSAVLDFVSRPALDDDMACDLVA